MGSWFSSTTPEGGLTDVEMDPNVVEVLKEVQKLTGEIKDLKEEIKQNDLLQRLKDINVYVKVAVIAIPTCLLGYYAGQKLLSRNLQNSDGSGNRKECPHLLPEPWRKIHQRLTEVSEIREDFVKRISEVWPQNDMKLNILLLGQAGSGKSSFVNACKTALLQDGRIVERAPVGGMGGEGITLRPMPYKLEIKIGVEKKYLPVQLFDCRGLFEGNRGVQTEDIKRICRGNIKAGYLINPEKGIKSGDKKYQKDPQEKDKMHCIVYVLAADEDGFVKEGVEKQLKEIKNLFREDTPQLILLTKIDRIGIHDITQIFRHKRVKQRCEEAATFLNFCVNDVFPQSSYSEETVPCEYKDLITLFNIKTIMERANDRVNEPVLSDDDSSSD